MKYGGYLENVFIPLDLLFVNTFLYSSRFIDLHGV
jgi:hypothetical protein